ncbi:MAG: LCP family protein [Acidimicrobiales bacterium]
MSRARRKARSTGDDTFSAHPQREKFASGWDAEPQVVYEEPDWASFRDHQAATYEGRKVGGEIAEGDGPSPVSAVAVPASPSSPPVPGVPAAESPEVAMPVAEAVLVGGTVVGGTRMERRLARRRAQRQRRLAVLALAGLVIAVGITVGILLMGGTASGKSKLTSSVVIAGSTPAAPAPVLLAHTNGTGQLDAVFVLAPGTPGKTGGVALVPPGTLTEVAGFGPEPLGSALTSLGPTGLLATTENLLGVGIAKAVVVNDAQLTALVAPAGLLTVKVAGDVTQSDAAGTSHVVFPAGSDSLTPERVPIFLSSLRPGDQLAQLTRQDAFITAWLAQLGRDPGGLPANADLKPVLAALAQGGVKVASLPVDELGPVAGAGTLFRVRSSGLGSMVASVFPRDSVQGGSRPKVQILNGTGTPGLDSQVFNKIVPSFEVSLTGNASAFGHASTQIVFYQRSRQAQALALEKLLGVGQLVLSQQPNGVVDFTVIVGSDFHQ